MYESAPPLLRCWGTVVVYYCSLQARTIIGTGASATQVITIVPYAAEKQYYRNIILTRSLGNNNNPRTT